jgi:hypothetical protein
LHVQILLQWIWHTQQVLLDAVAFIFSNDAKTGAEVTADEEDAAKQPKKFGKIEVIKTAIE